MQGLTRSGSRSRGPGRASCPPFVILLSVAKLLLGQHRLRALHPRREEHRRDLGRPEGSVADHSHRQTDAAPCCTRSQRGRPAGSPRWPVPRRGGQGQPGRGIRVVPGRVPANARDPVADEGLGDGPADPPQTYRVTSAGHSRAGRQVPDVASYSRLPGRAASGQRRYELLGKDTDASEDNPAELPPKAIITPLAPMNSPPGTPLLVR